MVTTETVPPKDVYNELDCQMMISHQGKTSILTLVQNQKGEAFLRDHEGLPLIPAHFFHLTIDADPDKSWEVRDMYIYANEFDPTLPHEPIGLQLAKRRVRSDSDSGVEFIPWENSSGKTVTALSINNNLSMRVVVGAIDPANGKILPKARP